MDVSVVPAEARPYQGETAGLVTRTVANALDLFCVCGLVVAGYAGLNALLFVLAPRSFQFVSASWFLMLTTALTVLVLYMAVAWALTGRTYGGHLMGLRVVDRRGRRLRLPRALLRALLCVGFPIGLLWCAGGSRRTSLQDIALRTLVIYDWNPLPPGPGRRASTGARA